MYGLAIGKYFMAERETHSYLIQSIHLLNGSFGEANKMHKRKTHKLWRFKSINVHLYCWMYMSKGNVWISMNMSRLYTLYHQSLVRSSHLTWDVWSHALLQSTRTFDIFSFLYFILNAKHPLFHQGLRKFHSIYMILEDTYFTIFSCDWHHRLVAMWCDIAP